MDEPTTPTLTERPGPRPESVLDSIAPTGARTDKRKRSSTRNAIEWVVVIAGALLVAVVVKTFLIQAFYIPSGSMEPTLQIGDRVLVNKVGYDLSDVHRGDIVVFARPDDWAAGPTDIDDLIKRVIGLPGEHIEVREGLVYINGAALDEPWDSERSTPPLRGACASGCDIPEGDIFVLGDNRDNSSASNEYGPLDFDFVVGRAFLRVWPIGDVGGL